MNELDARLTAALRTGAPPERDPLFRIEVLERIERGRFRREVLLSLLWIPGPYAGLGFSRTSPGVRAVVDALGWWFSR